MRKVFASDFDGALYFRNAEVKLPPENVEMVRRYQAAGHLFGLCTGRAAGGLTPFINGLITPDFFITSTGGNIVDRDLKPIFQRGIDRAVADAIVREMKPKGFSLTLDVDGEICVFAKMDYPGFYRTITGLGDAPQGQIHQITISAQRPEEASAASAWVTEHFGNQVSIFQNGCELNVAPQGCSKGKGINLLRDWMNKQWSDITLYSVGNSINDLPLMEAADVSYTFPHAPEILRKKATKIVPTIVHALLDSI